MSFQIYTTSSGSSIELSSIEATGSPRLLQALSLYVYGLYGQLLRSDDAGSTFTNIIPLSTATITALCQYTNSADTVTTAFSMSGLSVTSVKYQKIPEAAGTWQSGTTLPVTGFSAVDAIAGDLTSVPVGLPVIVGNGYRSIGSRIDQSTTPGPFAWFQSDTGLPTGILSAAAIITDLDSV